MRNETPLKSKLGITRKSEARRPEGFCMLHLRQTEQLSLLNDSPHGLPQSSKAAQMQILRFHREIIRHPPGSHLEKTSRRKMRLRSMRQGLQFAA